MKILMVSSEATPFAKAGGLADAVSALSRALERAGHEVRILIPRYYFIDRTLLEPVVGGLAVPFPEGSVTCSLYRTLLPDSSIPVYFLEHEGYFGRDGIYGTKTEPDFADNTDRFALLSRGAFALCRALDWFPDIFHAHDWPTALVPVYLRHAERGGNFASAASVLTIHNLGYQGLYPAGRFPGTGLPWALFGSAGFEQGASLNLLAAGLRAADSLTTVSPTYSREIQTPEFGAGLDSVLRHRSSSLVGILNGVDGGEWDPAVDKLLPARYSKADIKGKALCKAELQRLMGLPIDPAVPLVGMVSRLAEQKGIGELFGPMHGSAWRMCTEMALQFVVVGSGEAWCETELRSLSAKLPNFRARIGYDEKLAHLVTAGSDFILVPSHYEPCGLTQLYALKYGSLPIVRRTGGLADTVENYDQGTGSGTGFMFDQLTPGSVFDTTGWAVWAWYNKVEHIRAMRERAMSRVFSWDKSAIEFSRLYDMALAAAKARRGI
ncbi:MAG: glycogen/starch synthase [Treponema sp.]|nr:glycogen/starch synthase [Treponema sp.]